MNEKFLEIRNKFKKNDNDTGSSAFQIVTLTADIDRLIVHFSLHKKDCHGRRGLLQKVASRKSFLQYLKRTDEIVYKKLLVALDLKR